MGESRFFWVAERSGPGFCWYAPADPEASCGGDVANVHVARQFATEAEAKTWIAEHPCFGYVAREHGVMAATAHGVEALLVLLAAARPCVSTCDHCDEEERTSLLAQIDAAIAPAPAAGREGEGE